MKQRFALLSLLVTAAFAVPGLADEQAAATAKSAPLTLGVALYPGFELLDVYGPVEMFMNLGPDKIRVVMIAEKAGEVPSGSTKDKPGAWSGPRTVADYTFVDAPELDILMVPGGLGTMNQLLNDAYLQFVRHRSDKADLVTSVCSGSALLAKAGVLDGKRATCNKSYFKMLTKNGPNVKWEPKARWVEDGKFMTSSGVSAGTDMALAIIAKLFGDTTAQGVARGAEYVWNSDPANDPFAISP